MPKISALTDGTALTLTGVELLAAVKSGTTYRVTASQLLAAAGIGPSIVSIDNTVPRFDGVAGKLQTSGVTISDANVIGSAGISPLTNDGGTLGTSSLSFSDLFLASGGVISFNAGDVLLTHSSNKLTLTGGTFSIGATGDASLLYILDTVAADNLSGIKVAATFSGSITHNAGIFVENQVAAGGVAAELFGISINGLDIAAAGSATYISLRIADPTVNSGAGTVTSGKAIVVEGGICEFRGGIAGGLAVGSDLVLRTTTGTGDGTDYVIFQRGTNGATEMARMGKATTVAGLSINTTTITDNVLRFGASTSTGAGMSVDASGTSVAGTALSFIAGNSGTGGNLTGGPVTFITGSGRGNTTTNQAHAFYGYFPGASGDNAQTLTQFAEFSYTATATQTFLRIYDVDNATLERVTVGAADSGGAGFKYLRIPN